MALPFVIANTVQVRLLWSINSQLSVNVLHGLVPSGFVANQAVANTLGSAIKSAFTSNLGARFAANNSLVRVGLRDVRQANQTEFLDTGAAVAGTGTEAALPGGLALCVTLRTAMSGKTKRGRVYISGFDESVNEPGGGILGAAITNTLAFMTGVDTAFDASQLTLAVASRPAERYTIVKTTFHADGTSTVDVLTEGAARTGSSEAVTAFQSRNALWESQRRRMNGRGVAPTALQAGTVVQSQHSGRTS